MVYENSQKFSTKFYCEKCDYYANRKSDLLKHFKSNKHNDTKNSQNDTKKFSIKCECGKVYKFNSGFYRHKKNCTFVKNETIILEDSSNNNVSINKKNINETVNCLKEDDYKNMFLKLLDENKEFKDILIKQQTQIGQLIPKIGNNNINNVVKVVKVFKVVKNSCNVVVILDDGAGPTHPTRLRPPWTLPAGRLKFFGRQTNRLMLGVGTLPPCAPCWPRKILRPAKNVVWGGAAPPTSPLLAGLWPAGDLKHFAISVAPF